MANNILETPVHYYEPVGECIYCGSLENLTNEHIIPLSLNGTDVLPAASCDECAGITSKFERIVARDMYGNLRNKLGYTTRRKKLRPTSLPVSFRTPDGATKSFQYTLAELPINFSIAYLPPPGILTGVTLMDKAPRI